MMKAHCVHKSQYTCFLTTRVTAELMGNGHRLHQFPEEIKETTIEVRSTTDL